MYEPGNGNRTIGVKCNSVDRFRMTLLMQNFDTLFQIPESPGIVKDTSGQKPARWMELDSGNTVRSMALHIGDRLFALQIPQFHGTIHGARG